MMDRCGRVDMADHGTGRTRSHGGLESDKVMLFPYPRAMSRRTARAWVRGLRGGSQERPSQQSVVEGPDLDALAHTWDVLGEHDPLWAVLTRPGTQGGRWDVEEFFLEGAEQVDGALGLVEGEIGWHLATGAALDFGCGVGRLTQALCRRFDRVDGVDIAPSMIRGAERFNRFGDRCRYHLNARDDLDLPGPQLRLHLHDLRAPAHAPRVRTAVRAGIRATPHS